jgi:biopolymer transport protein ExbB/TolQ
MTIEHLLFDISDALRYPVLALALLSLVAVIVEVGILLAELRRRRGRGVARLERAVDVARDALATGDGATALRAVRSVGLNAGMDEALRAVVEQRDRPDAANRIAKRLAEYDYRSVRRLERTRILVRMGPALGLMGTLIPLSPALAGLANGDVQRLTDDLRVAFSVTVTGLLVGAVAYAVSLVRNRLYDQDYSDVEYVAATLAPDGVDPRVPVPSAPPPHRSAGHEPGAPAEALTP